MKKILLTFYVIIIGLLLNAQNFNKEISLNNSFSKSTDIYPFNAKEIITSIAVSGNITFHSDTSFVRIIVDDGNGHVYMLYEVYPMLTVEKRFHFEYKCEETSFLVDYFPVGLQIQLRDAIVNIDKILLSNEQNTKAQELNLSKFEGVPEGRGSLENITVAPNPTTGQLKIDASACSATNGGLKIESVEIFDVYGRKQKAESRNENENENEIDISNLSTGLYFVKIKTAVGEVVKKIVKQ